MKTNFQFPFYAKVALVFIGLFAFIGMLFIAQHIIVPIIYATIIAIVLSPIVEFFVRKKINRIVAVSITVIFVITITLLVLALLLTQLMQFSDSVPQLVERFHNFNQQFVSWVSDTFNISTRKTNLWIKEKNVEFLKETNALIGQTIVHIGSILIILVLIPVYVFMILYYQPLLLGFIHRLFNTEQQTQVNQVLTATKKIIKSYLVGLLLEAGIIAILNSVSLLILGIEYAILLGVIGAIVNVIPYLGGIIAVALPMIIALVTKSSITSCVLILVAYVVIQFIDNHYIIPKVVASKVKVNALISVIVVLAGGALWGVPGMFLAIPLTAILKVVFDHIDALKPWGFLLGDTMPALALFKLKTKNKLP